MSQASHAPRQLRRNTARGVIGGVCAGLAEFFGINLMFTRVVFILLVFASGAGLVVYLILFLVMPPVSITIPSDVSGGEAMAYRPPPPRSRLTAFGYLAGIISICASVATFVGDVSDIVGFINNYILHPPIVMGKPTAQPWTPGGGQIGNGAETSLEQQRTQLKQVILEADRAEIQALRSLDPTPLYSVYGGAQLQRVLGYIEDLQANGLYEEQQLEAQEFQAFDISTDGTRATVQLMETWSGTMYSRTSHDCVARIPTHDVPQTLYLEQGVGGWTIVAADFDDAAEVEPVPCS